MNCDLKTKRMLSRLKRCVMVWFSIAGIALFVCILWARISQSSEPPRYIDISKDLHLLQMVGDYENRGCRFISGMNGVVQCGNLLYTPRFFVHLSDGSSAVISEPTTKHKVAYEFFTPYGNARFDVTQISIEKENGELYGAIPLSGRVFPMGVVSSEDGSHLAIPREPWIRIPMLIHYSVVDVWDIGKISKILTVPVPGLHYGELPLVALNSRYSLLIVVVNNELQCWDFLRKKELFRIRSGESEIFTGNPSFSKDGKYFMMNCKNQPTMVFDSRSGEFQFWFLYRQVGNTLDWAMITPDGRYDGTKGALQYIKIWCEEEQLYLLPSQNPSREVSGLGMSFFPKSREWYPMTPY